MLVGQGEARMKRILWIATLALTLSAHAKEISVSGDAPVQPNTEAFLHSADKLAIKDENGEIVAYKLGKVEKNSTLAKMGLKKGDILNMPKAKKKSSEETRKQ